MTILSYSCGRSDRVGIGPLKPTSPPRTKRCIILLISLARTNEVLSSLSHFTSLYPLDDYIDLPVRPDIIDRRIRPFNL
jgi:hypothetical protein